MSVDVIGGISSDLGEGELKAVKKLLKLSGQAQGRLLTPVNSFLWSL